MEREANVIRPLTGQILLRVLPPKESENGIVFPQRTLSPEEQQQLNHHPEPPPPDIGIVEAIGPWPRTNDGKMIPPPFPPGAKVLVREGSGQKLHRDIGERLKLVRTDDVLAVLQDT